MSRETPAGRVYVWDLFVRTFHWVLVITFFVSYFTEDLRDIHVWFGYAVGVLIIVRIVWGFIGPRHARFSSFLYRPSVTLSYVFSLLTFRSERYIGHSPGGGAMVLALLVCLAITVVSGLAVYGGEDKAGPLAPLFTMEETTTDRAAAPPVAGGESESEEAAHREHEESPLIEALEGIHEFFANFTLALVIIHIAAVILASIAHRESLVKAMLTGYKRS